MKNTKKIAGLLAGALVGALVLGSASLALAAGPADATSPGLGIRLGEVVRDAGARLVDIVADLTGLSVDEVEALRQDGSSIADIAESEGVSTDAVVDGALAVRQTLLDEKVADGTIDQATADAALDRMADRIDTRITSTETGPFGAGSGGAGYGTGGQGGHGAGMGTGDALRDGSCATD